MFRGFNRETLDVNADNRLPASHRFLFLVNSLMLAAVQIYIFSQIFDMDIEDNLVLFGGVSVVSAVMLTMACQVRSKALIGRLINKRGIELQVPTARCPNVLVSRCPGLILQYGNPRCDIICRPLCDG